MFFFQIWRAFFFQTRNWTGFNFTQPFYIWRKANLYSSRRLLRGQFCCRKHNNNYRIKSWRSYYICSIIGSSSRILHLKRKPFKTYWSSDTNNWMLLWPTTRPTVEDSRGRLWSFLCSKSLPLFPSEWFVWLLALNCLQKKKRRESKNIPQSGKKIRLLQMAPVFE